MRCKYLAVSAISLMSATQAFGQANDPFLLGAIFLGTDATAADGEISVNNQDLTRNNPTDLQDVFKSQPAVQVGSSIPVYQKIFVNGVEENNLSITIDGARQNSRIFHHAATTYIDPELLRAVRVDPGVAPADAGPGAMGGAIAFETKEVYDLLAPGRNSGGRVSSEFQSNGASLANSLALYGRPSSFEYLFFGKRASSGDVRRDGAGADINGSETDLSSGLAKFALNLEDGSRLEMSYESVKDDAQRPNRPDFAALPRRGVLNDGTRKVSINRRSAVITYAGHGYNLVWNPTIQLAGNATDLFTGPFAGEAGAYAGESTSLTGKAQNEFSLPGGTLTAGVDFYRDAVDIAGEGAASHFAEEKAGNVGIFAQGRIDLTERLRMSDGLRYDHQTFEGVDGTKYNNGGFSASLAADYDVADRVTLSVGASRIWGGIALAESFLFDTGWTYPESIDPVTSQNIYLGFKADIGNGYDLSGKVFRTNIENARTLYESTGTETHGASPGDTSDLDAEGFELGAGYDWGLGFARLAYASVSAEVNGFDADSHSGRYLTTPLGNTLVLEAVHTFYDIGLTVGPDIQHTMGRDITYPGAPSGKTEDYTVLNAFAEYKPEHMNGMTLRLGISNLFNEDYSESATYGQEFGAITPLKEPGRTITAKLIFVF